jgi:hypothetical protein
MKVNYIVILFFLFSNCINSQEIKESNWILKLNTVQLIDIFSYPTIQVSAEKKINPYFSVNAEFGYQLYEIDRITDTVFLKPKGFKSNIEGRLYLLKLLNSRIKSEKTEFYFGLQFFYRKNQNTNVVNYSPKVDSTKLYRDYFGAKRTVHGINLTIGGQISFGKKIIIEPFLGLGVFNSKIKNTNIQYNKTKDDRGGTGLVPLFQRLNLEQNSGTHYNFSYGFRVGYKL